MLCGGTLLHFYLRALEQRAGGGSLVKVVATTQDAVLGTTLTRAMLGTRDLPEAYVESRHLRAEALDELVGARLRSSVRAGETLCWSDIVGVSEQTRALSSLVRVGMRAFFVRSTQAEMAAQLQPGDRVDVLFIPGNPAQADVDASSRTLLEAVLVLAVDGRTDALQQEPRGAQQAATGVTLAVTNDQGLALASAQGRGSLQLLLRHPDDVPAVSTSTPSIVTRSLPPSTGGDR